MKRYLSTVIILAAAVGLLPAIPVCLGGKSAESSHAAEKPEQSAEDTSEAAEESADSEPEAEETAGYEYSGEPYKVLDVSTGEVLEVPERDYVIGAVCAEMPASFSEEALKAQAVAAHTYAERQRMRERQSPTAELNGADFSNDTSKYQGYFTQEQAKQYFGDRFDESYAKISAAADEVLPYLITYNDEPIISAFHSMSSGRTESAENAWGASVDYLVPVDSSYDVYAPKYMEDVRYEKDVLRNKLETAFEGVTLGDDMTSWLSIGQVSDSGTVLTATVGDKTVSGNDVRTALSLRSPCFEVKFDGDAAIITTKGYGHGVGMSQYGANAMASQGSTWQDIISHYYPACEIVSLY